MKRLGIMGGTFDPPHIGHLAAAEMARAELKLDCVLFVPANRSPWKMSKVMTTTEQRLELVRLAIADTGIGVWDVDVIAGSRQWSPEFKAICGLPPDAEAPVLLAAGADEETVDTAEDAVEATEGTTPPVT